MRALVMDAGRLELQHDKVAAPLTNDDVLIDVCYTGICETDLQLLSGYMAFRGTPGHEFVGVATTGPYAGRRVVGEINCPCRCCPVCREHRATHCPHRTVLGILNREGAFAEQVYLPQSNLHLVPDAVSDVEAVFVEPLAAAFRILEQYPYQTHEQAVVLGDGRLGNLCTQVLATAGWKVMAVGKHPHKLALLARLGISTLLLDEIETSHWADVVVDCTGSASGWHTALRFLKPTGTYILKTTIAEQYSVSLATLVIDELRVIGSRCGPFAPAIEALASRRVSVGPLVEDIYPLSKAPEAFQRALTEPVLKLLIDVRV